MDPDEIYADFCPLRKPPPSEPSIYPLASISSFSFFGGFDLFDRWVSGTPQASDYSIAWISLQRYSWRDFLLLASSNSLLNTGTDLPPDFN